MRVENLQSTCVMIEMPSAIFHLIFTTTIFFKFPIIYRLGDISEELLTVIAEVLLSELTFLRLVDTVSRGDNSNVSVSLLHLKLDLLFCIRCSVNYNSKIWNVIIFTAFVIRIIS